MTFINLRKHPPADTTPDHHEPPEDLDDEAPDDDQPDEQDREVTFLAALPTGVKGWWTLTSRPLGTRGAYTAHALALWSAAHYGGWILVAVVLVLTAGVASFMPAQPFDRMAGRLLEAGRTPPQEQPAQPPQDPLVTVLWTLIADAPGTHLKTLAHTLAKAAEKEGCTPPTKADTERALTARGIPLRPSVRDTRDKVNKGVHREDLEAWQNT
ncbi:hypothetical protein PYK79_57325, partial [Streptomyces sp. ID05-04B]|uniref:hypothetical protein n=1 Tax=Streptomyces sp. ID05-04B TaxID=3028661 RepID=UPI0029C39D2E